MLNKEEVVVCQLGRMPYEPTWKLQRSIQSVLISAKRADPPVKIPHVLLIVEHAPIYTLGKSGDKQHLLVSEAELKQQGASFINIDRGGDITFHGPGQIVGYPMLDLDRISPDVHLYLRNLEEMGIRTCGDYGLKAGRVSGKTGVWLDAENESQSRKICAMGIRCSRWVSMHGFAFNVNTDLKFFDNIVPCGIANRAVTTLGKETGRLLDEQHVLTYLLKHFASVFNVNIQIKDFDESLKFLGEYLPEPLTDFALEPAES